MKKILLFVFIACVGCDGDPSEPDVRCSIPIYTFSPTGNGAHTFDVRIVSSMHIAVNTESGDVKDSFRQMGSLWKLYIKKNSETPIELPSSDVDIQGQPSPGAGWTVYSYSGSFNISDGDEVLIYGERQSGIYTAITIWTSEGARYDPLNGPSTTYGNVTGFSMPSYVKISDNTAYPDNKIEGPAECIYLYGQFAD